MAAQASNEGRSTYAPLYFNKNNYNCLKARMKIYLKSIDSSMWDMLEKGYTLPTTTIEGVDIRR